MERAAGKGKTISLPELFHLLSSSSLYYLSSRTSASSSGMHPTSEDSASPSQSPVVDDESMIA